jgi:zinc protease
VRSDLFSSALAALAAASGLGAVPVSAGGLERLVLPNGLEVILVRKDGVPLVTVEIAIRAGAFIETPELDGLTHLHEHMFFKANRAIPDQTAYLRRLEELGTSWNGSTSHEVVRYFFTLPRELLKEGLEFLRDAIESPLFLAEELEKERKVVIGEYDRNEASPPFHLRRAVEKALFGKYFSRKNVIGDRQVISTAPREKLQFIQEQFYVPNNAALLIAGEFDPAEGRRLAQEVFGGWERRPDPFQKNPVPRHPPLERDAHLVVEQPVSTASILFGWHGPSVDQALEDAVAGDVIATALNHPTSRFHRALVDSGLATRAALSYYTLKHTGPIHLQIETTPEKTLDALRAARRELDNLSRPGYLSAEELARAARQLIVEDAFEREKSRDFAISLGFWWSVGGIESYLNYPKLIQEVGPGDLVRFAGRYLPAGGARTAVGVMVSPEARKAAGITPEAIERALSGGPEGAERPEPAGSLSSRELGNHARLISRRVEGTEVAAFSLYFRDLPARSRPEEAGLEELLLRTLADELERAYPDELARLGARVRFQVQPDFSTFGVQCLKAGLDRSAELVAEALRKLELKPADVERNRARMLDIYAKTMDNPDQAVGFVANRTFYPPGHPYLAYPGGTKPSLKRLTQAALEKRRAELLAGRRILAVVVGDLERAAAERLVERAVGDLPAGEPARAELPPLAGPPGGISVEERAIPTCYVLGKFRCPAPGEPDFEALSLALSILHRKMFLEVRSKRALTYAVMGGSGERRRNAGYLYVTTTRPSEALSAMYQTLDRLIAEPLPEDELRGAALSYSTRQYLRQESAAEEADALALEELVAGDHRRTLDLTTRLARVTPADIRRVLKEHVRGIHFGVIGPGDLVGKLDRALFASR